MGKIVLFVVAALVLSVGMAYQRVSAQAVGMSKATAKTLVSDLMEAGFTPTISLVDGVYTVQVQTTDTAAAPSAATVSSFAASHTVQAKVLSVQFQ